MSCVMQIRMLLVLFHSYVLGSDYDKDSSDDDFWFDIEEEKEMGNLALY